MTTEERVTENERRIRAYVATMPDKTLRALAFDVITALYDPADPERAWDNDTLEGVGYCTGHLTGMPELLEPEDEEEGDE